MAAGRLVLRMVGELHRRGYEQVCLAPGMSPSGMHWRCQIMAATHRDGEPDPALAAFYTTGQVREYFAWTDAADDDVVALADKFLARYPALCAQARQLDPAYVTWYRAMLRVTEPDGLSIAYADWSLPSGGLTVVNGPPDLLVPWWPPVPGAPDPL